MSSSPLEEIPDWSHPHSPAYSYNSAPPEITTGAAPKVSPTAVVATIPADETDIADVLSWLSSRTSQSDSTSTPTSVSSHMAQSTSFISVAPNPAIETQMPQTPGNPEHDPLSRAAKIGLAVGIALGLVLTIFAILFMFNCKDRRKERSDTSEPKRTSDSSWGTVFGDARSSMGRSPRNSKAEGLWAKLRAGERLDKDLGLRDVRRNSMLDEYERRLHNVGFWEPDGVPRSLEQGRVANKDLNALPRAHESVPEFLPVYIPSNRFSWGEPYKNFETPPIVSASAPVLAKSAVDNKETK